MKAASLALACALLGATALAPASFAQTPPSPPQTPAEASPATTSPDANARTGTSAQRDWREQDGRVGGWRSGRNDDDDRFSAQEARGGRYADDDDDDDDMHDGPHGGMDRGMDRGMRGDISRGPRGDDRRAGAAGPRMSPEMMRMHMQMMSGRGGARLNLKRGDSAIDVRCPSGENIAACVDAVGKLMDRLQAMPQTPR